MFFFYCCSRVRWSNLKAFIFYLAIPFLYFFFRSRRGFSILFFLFSSVSTHTSSLYYISIKIPFPSVEVNDFFPIWKKKQHFFISLQMLWVMCENKQYLRMLLWFKIVIWIGLSRDAHKLFGIAKTKNPKQIEKDHRTVASSILFISPSLSLYLSLFWCMNCRK